ncbi:LOW QUALITY PROTEIN: uncharacterized protein LOC116340162 [Contarinia nasturtii]|uniref:LOW QUALITY PROTEIN: uncharacterized protein LOC116340162 n=1 Tax=Contarinia nasturtii TaxID=265458 RepID=UPI0012D420D1|nr:LOW QUALITY PROTEIN: uncharacterized protein LOC116340162 [Contarinia nasturtii]
MSANVLMALPKYVSIPNKNGLPISADPIESFIGCGKKRRLDHLTWEEKLQRKKLKNRVAAQTSRDRKKAKMDEMDQTVKRLRDENVKLKEQTERLTADKEELLKRTIELERCLNDLQGHQFDIDESAAAKLSHKHHQSNIKIESTYDSPPLSDRWIGCGIMNNNGSAVSAYPLPKGSQIKPQSMRRSDNTCNNYMTATQHQQQQQHHQQQTLTPPSTPPPAHQSQPFELSKRATTSSSSRINQRATSMDEMPVNLKSNSDQAALWKIIALCLLPDLFGDIEDFDASGLEELAESLFADVSTEFENDVTKGGHRIAQIEGEPKSMFRSMVGTQTENMESSEDTHGSLNTPIHKPSMVRTIKQEIIDSMTSDDDQLYVPTAPIAPENQLQSIQHMHFDHTQFNHSEEMFDNINHNSSNNTNTTTTTTSHTNDTTDKSMILYQNDNNVTITDEYDTLYETTTYDDEGNQITIILPDEDISNFEEVIEEVPQNEDEDDDEIMSHVSVLSPIPSINYASPGGYSHNSSIDDPTAGSDHDSAYDSVINSPPATKLSSSWSIDDDYVYFNNSNNNNYWPQDSFSELFPTLA